MTTGSLSLVVCHANSPTDGAFPSKQILSTSDSNGLSGIQAPYEINFRDQKVAGSNPVTSTRKSRKPKGFRFFFCIICTKRRLWRFFHATNVQPWEKGQRHVVAYPLYLHYFLYSNTNQFFILSNSSLYAGSKSSEASLVYNADISLWQHPIFCTIFFTTPSVSHAYPVACSTK